MTELGPLAWVLASETLALLLLGVDVSIEGGNRLVVGHDRAVVGCKGDSLGRN
jgi:hypothetical protein